MKKISVFFVFVVFLFSSCSSIVKGSKQLVSIDSNVKGAEVLVDGKTVGQTPFMAKINRGSSTSITVKKEGYSSKSIVANTSIEPLFWGNLLYAVVPGSITDLATGAMYKYSPTNFQIDLEALTAPAKGTVGK